MSFALFALIHFISNPHYLQHCVRPWVQTGGVPLQVLLGRQVLCEFPMSS